jgi:raffinose/stachyose/melibiose transport system permease protein
MITRREQAATYTILGFFALIALLPIVGILLTALQQKGGGATFGTFDGLHVDNFKRAWEDGNFGQYLKSSLIVAVAVVALSTFVSILAGYAFGLMRFRDLALTDTYWALILPQAGVSTAFGTFWMRAFFRSVPRSLVEAARIDGASSWFTLWRVLMPLARPAVLTMVVLLFMWTWNEFLLALVMVTDEGLRTAPLGLSFFVGRNQADLTLLAAGAVIVATPVVILYVFLQRHFIRGMVSGAVKG